ncbi:MAG: hypothetical protein M3114_01360, partial [Thermoproteota archaeon]|nr:hypothetical protein [Thermoproteota archaeon]
LIAYPDEHDQYYTFMTPEAYGALKEWMDYRALHGETINENSWLMRDKWRTVDVKRGDKCGRVGLATHPKKLSYDGIKKILNRALWDQGLRNVLSEGERRHDWKQAHGFRKFFKTRAEQVMNRSNVELLIGHSSGLQGSYYKPTEEEVLEDYLKAVPLLKINDNNVVSLKEEQQALERKQEDKDREIQQLRQEQQKIMNNLKQIMPMLLRVTQKLRAENAQLREASAEMEKSLTEDEREQIEKELQEEDEQAAKDGTFPKIF